MSVNDRKLANQFVIATILEPAEEDVHMAESSARVGAISVLAFLLFAFPAANVHSAQKPSTFTVAYSAISYDQLPAWIAKDTGLFARNGLDVQLVYFTGGSTAAMALVSGDVAISQNAGPEVVNAYLAGSDPVFVAAGTTTLDWWLMGRSEVKTPAQLKGGSVAISRFGSVSDFVARFALQRIGLVPEKDTAIVQVGTNTDRFLAMSTKRVEAGVFNPPTSFIGQKNGFTVLADVASLGLAFQHTGVVTTRRFIRENPDTVARYVKVQVEAVHRLKTDRETGLRVAAKYFGKVRDKESMERAYDRYIGDNQLPRKQYPSLEGLKTVIGTLGEKARGLKPEDLVDLRFIKELDQSGFIDALYGR
jgi:NitT/TauT family transport system substrate-binding protein